MKLILLLAFCAAAAASLFPEDERISGENGWYVPQSDGSLLWTEKELGEKYLETMSKFEDVLIVNPVKCFLYTKDNPDLGQEIVASKESIDASNFNANNPTRITISGWNTNLFSYTNIAVREAYLSLGDYNMISVEWSRARSADYASSVIAIPGVGKEIAALVDFLVENYDLNLDTLEIVGHSLGAHVAGFTGKNIMSGKVHAIIGLDPALPLFSYDKPDTRLSSTDALYVESIHTDGGKLGFLKPIGQAAFYPNGGESQPACVINLMDSCDHMMAVSYYAEALKDNTFATIRCSSYEDAVTNSCGSDYSSVRMGDMSNDLGTSGVFYVPVNNVPPFGPN